MNSWLRLRNVCKNFFGPALLASCLCAPIAHAGPETHETPGVLELSEILRSKAPMVSYSQAYQAFQATSETRLASSGEGTPARTTTKLERDEHGNAHFVRSPMSSGATTELLYVSRSSYLRTKEGGTFQRVRYQNEFDRWMENTFREIFGLFVESGFAGSKLSESKGEMKCAKRPEGEICVDPTTGLPLEGTLRTTEASTQQKIDIVFRVKPAEPGALQIQLPRTP